jgi:DNA-binding GntR family transcriptional regulator
VAHVDLPRLQNSHLKDEAYRLIKEAITSVHFRPGDPVIEGDLARRLGISKTPVRNALVRLEQEGFVQTLPFRGTFVADVSVGDVREIYEVRSALEETAIRLLIERLSSADIRELRSAIAEVEAKLQAGQLEESFDSIREFHEGIVRRSGNRWLIEMYGTLSGHLTRIRNICGHIPGRVEKSVSEHKTIIAAIEAHDSPAAIVALRAHLESLTGDYSQAAAAMIEHAGSVPPGRRAAGNGV